MFPPPWGNVCPHCSREAAAEQPVISLAKGLLRLPEELDSSLGGEQVEQGAVGLAW